MNNSLSLAPIVTALRLAAGGALVVGLMSGCAMMNKFQAQSATEAPPVAAKPVKPAPLPDPEPPQKTKLYEWSGEGQAVTHIKVDLDEQKAHFYEGDKEVGWTYVAAGVRKHPTPVGSFSVREKVANKESNLYGKIYGEGGKVINSNAKMGKTPIPPGGRFDGADMPYFLRLTNDGIGMHAGPIPKPGRPASHGCIRMPKGFAPIAFRHVGIGTEVSIVGKGPSYAQYLAMQPKSTPKPKPAVSAPAQQAADQAAVAAIVAGATGAPVPDGRSPDVVAVPKVDGDAAQFGGPVGAGGEAPAVSAVAHDPVPPVAPAIAMRSEGPDAPAPAGPTVLAAPSAPGSATPAAPAVPPAPRAEAPGTAPVAPLAAAPAVPGPVYYPAPRVPAFQAPAQVPVMLPPPAPPVETRPTPVVSQPKEPAAGAAAAQPEAPRAPTAVAQPKSSEPAVAPPTNETPREAG
jgi:lipoprotein-anchoring transpeptidase ErfK/SrfK